MQALSENAPEKGGSERILHAATTLMAREGASGLTIQRVCRDADVTPPTLYYHFSNKDGLIAAVLESVASSWLEALRTGLATGNTLEEQISAATDGWESMITAPDRPLLLILSIQLHIAESSPQIRGALLHIREKATDEVRRALRHWLGDHPAVESHADATVGLVNAAALAFQVEGDLEALRTRLDSIGTMLTSLLGEV